MTADTTMMRALAVEHAMRTGAPEPAVLAVVVSVPGSRQALAALGKILEATHVELTPASPLVVWCSSATITTVAPDWRDGVPESAGLWAEIEDLRTVFATLDGTFEHPYAELCALREAADASLAL